MPEESFNPELLASLSGEFETADLSLPIDTLLRMQGYRDLARVRPRVRALAEQALEEAAPVLNPKAVHQCLPLDRKEGASLSMGGRSEFHSAELADILSESQCAIVFAMTVGPEIDELVDTVTAQGDMAKALFVDTVGWLAVERATHRLAQALSQRAQSRGLRLTRRLAPGYADWPLEEQAGLFTLLEGTRCPVTLLESGAMLPKKSRSGLYGLRAVKSCTV